MSDDASSLVARLPAKLSPLPRIADLPKEFEADRGGDHALNVGSRPLRSGPLSPAAVLVGVVDHPGAPTVLLTRRTQHLSNHSGQIAFPGGRLDPSDADLADCALREAEEEIGLASRHVTVIGALSPYITITGFVVTPVVGIVRPGFSLHPNPGEVAAVFDVPLAFLLDEKNHRREGGYFNGTERFWWAIPYGEHYIWGATAGMLRDLFQRWNGG